MTEPVIASAAKQSSLCALRQRVIHTPPSLRAQRSNPAFVRCDADDPGEPQRWIASLRSQ
ncbi:MAG: hypothetical protein HEQ16_08545 [Bosea sp.]|nr:hypothetical protein [Bosea sp. (in: a-proteobacteria)]